MKTITIKDETHAELKARGEMGDSFDAVIRKLLECCKEAKQNE